MLESRRQRVEDEGCGMGFEAGAFVESKTWILEATYFSNRPFTTTERRQQSQSMSVTHLVSRGESADAETSLG